MVPRASKLWHHNLPTKKLKFKTFPIFKYLIQKT